MGAALTRLPNFHFDEVEEAGWDGVAGISELHVVKFFVEAVFISDKIVVGTDLDSFTVGEDKNAIGVLDGGEAMSNREHGAVGDQTVDCFLDEAFAFGVESGGCFV